MTFNSLEFLIFYPIVAALYFLLPKRAKWPMLLIASYYFYAFFNLSLLTLIVGTTLVSWVASLIMQRSEKPLVRRLCLATTLVVCLGVLFFFKYFNFLSSSVSGIITLLGGEAPEVVLDLILPVGISFYTFQTLSYVIDVYRKDVIAERNFFFYALFVSFFPQLVAGPIERPDNLIPQLRESHKWSNENFIRGGQIMIVGFFKKICVADVISTHVDSVYNNVSEATALGVIVATALFAVQIYCDFSGYTDIATGCARIMGIKLMKNFDHPYESTSIKEFWGRWHISLSSWFRDYLYIPLGGNRCGRIRHLLNLFIVFAVSGLWHGANWTYVIWGMLHGVYQIIGTLTVKPRNKLLEKMGIDHKGRAVTWMRRVIVFLLVDFAWLFFRAGSVEEAFSLITTLFTGWGTAPAEALSLMGFDLVSASLCIVTVIALLFIDRLMIWGESPDGAHRLVKRGAFIYYVWIILLCWILLLSHNMTSSFIYFQF